MFSDLKRIRRLERELKRVKQLDAKILINQMRSAGQLQRLADAEFQVSSQFGEDGILQYLIHRVGDLQHKFIECGVETYVEANTRFLLENNNWSGLVIDCDQKAMEQLRQDDIYWRHDFTSVGAFITRDNINELCQSSGFTGEIGLLSIDIDGNDYWVWKAINAVQPTIVSIEFNSLFGDQHPISIPYDPAFTRGRAHSSMMYWGCSLPALCHLAEQRGYAHVGCDSVGLNAYFVRKDAAHALRTFSAQEGYVRSSIRQSRDKQGNLSFRSFAQTRQEIGDLPVIDVVTGKDVRLRELSWPDA